MRTRDPVYSLVSRRPLLSSNQIEVHRPVFRRTTLPPVSAQQRLELEDLYQRLKMNFEKSNQDVNLKKRLRKDDQPQLGFDNVNVVIPGQSLLSQSDPQTLLKVDSILSPSPTA